MLLRPATHTSDCDARAMYVQMIGFMEATEGDAIINGLNIKTSMNEIYTCMVRSQRENPESLPSEMRTTSLCDDVCKAQEQRTSKRGFLYDCTTLNALMHECNIEQPQE
jgi:hypothetical protein